MNPGGAAAGSEGDDDAEGARGGGRLWVHFAFGAAYAVLLLRLLPLLAQLPADGWPAQAVEVAADLFAGQFTGMFSMFEDDPRMLVPNVVFALVGYGAIHYAATARLPEDAGDSRMLKFMYFCRSLLYLFVTLLVVLVVVRMFILVYQDLSRPSVVNIRAVGTPAR